MLSKNDGLALPSPSVIQRSWQRCMEHGLSPSYPARHNPLAAAELKRRREQNQILLQLAGSELTILRRAIAGTSGMVLLSGSDGTILDACGDSDFVGRARRVSLQPGADWNEIREGTNAVGTALVERQLVEVRGEQHFLEDNQFLVCTAMPIMEPSGELAGVIDISGDVRQPPEHSSMLVQLAAARIEHSWVGRNSDCDLLVGFHVHPSYLKTPHEGLLAFRDELLVGANTIALHLLGLHTENIHRLRWLDIFRDAATYGERELHPRAYSGVFYGRVERTRVDHPRLSVVSSRSSAAETILRDGAVWDSESLVLLAKATRAIDAGIPILLQGETGTGKEIFVRALHRHSSRSAAPFVPVNCAAIPEGLLEAEIFGYEEGAFTGARRRGNLGHIRRAEGGILFLDEIGDMPLALQARLLRVLQDGEVTPLGGSPVRVDFRLVTATHHDLQAAVAAKSFRADLYYRLRHMVLTLPPLRERQNLPQIVDTMLGSFGAEARGIRLSSAARQHLLHHAWPGNLRELANLLRTLVSLAEDDSVIDVESLPSDILAPEHLEPEMTLSDVTGAALRRALEQHRGNMTAAARQLGLHRSTLYRRLHHEARVR